MGELAYYYVFRGLAKLLFLTFDRQISFVRL